jgi:hypothetical protein
LAAATWLVMIENAPGSACSSNDTWAHARQNHGSRQCTGSEFTSLKTGTRIAVD